MNANPQENTEKALGNLIEDLIGLKALEEQKAIEIESELSATKASIRSYRKEISNAKAALLKVIERPGSVQAHERFVPASELFGEDA